MRRSVSLKPQIPDTTSILSSSCGTHADCRFHLLPARKFSSGRGRGSGHPPVSSSLLDFIAGSPKVPDAEGKSDLPLQPSGRGHGRGKPFPGTSVIPELSPFRFKVDHGIGRGKLNIDTRSNKFAEPNSGEGQSDHSNLDSVKRDTTVPLGLSSALRGAGRGKPVKQIKHRPEIREENRHIRVKEKSKTAPLSGGTRKSKPEFIHKDENVNVQSQGRGEMAKRRGRGRSRGRERGSDQDISQKEREREDDDEDLPRDDACAEELAKTLGAEKMKEFTDILDEAMERVSPSPGMQAYLDALETNYMIECEPEYLLEQFDQNPDIDDKPVIPLRDALERVKPFLMAYEGIQSQEEWEAAMERTMEHAPLMKQIVDCSGPDRITAKKQVEELERITNNVPPNAPFSVKLFTERALLSLQSNPGWKFEKKCGFMNKLVLQVSQHQRG